MTRTPHPPLRRWALAPLALALLMGLHGDPGAAPSAFVLRHLVALPLFVLTSVAGWRLLAGVAGPLADGARGAFVVFALSYTLYDLLAGVYAGGLMWRLQSAADPLTVQASVRNIQALLGGPLLPVVATLGGYAWALALLLSLVGLWDGGSQRRTALLLLVPAAFALLFDHPGTAGVVAFGGFAAVLGTIPPKTP
ncbi:MAG: hypothetical protein U5L04_17555 [Trueperaceae bacterium]|nr:hypothetical protein [Trueperaceae bacterium]